MLHVKHWVWVRYGSLEVPARDGDPGYPSRDGVGLTLRGECEVCWGEWHADGVTFEISLYQANLSPGLCLGEQRAGSVPAVQEWAVA